MEKIKTREKKYIRVIRESKSNWRDIRKSMTELNKRRKHVHM
jgi:hypothetical protein